MTFQLIIKEFKDNYELIIRIITTLIGFILFVILLILNFLISPSADYKLVCYGIVCMLLLVSIEFYYFRKSGWLSYLVNKELKIILSKEGYYWRNLFRRYLINPSLDYGIFILWIAGSLLFGFIISLLVTKISPEQNQIWIWRTSVNVQFIKDAMQLIATVFTICIAIIVFAAESIQKSLPQFSSLYYKKTKIIPTIFIGIISIIVLFCLTFLWNSYELNLSPLISVSIYDLVVLDISLIGLLLINIIRFQRNYLDMVLEYISSEIRNNVYFDVHERIRFSVFHKQLDQHNFSSYVSDKSSDLKAKANESGIVTDINISGLKRLYKKFKSKDTEIKLAVMGVGYEVQKDKDTVLTISNAKQRKLSAIGIIKVQSPTKKSKQPGDQAIRKLLIDAIKSEDVAQTEKLLDSYRNLSNDYMDELYKIGFRFDKKQAVEFGWLKLYFHDYLREDFEEFVRQAAKIGNTDLIRTIIYKARMVLVDTIEKQNILLFNSMGYLFPRLYWLTKNLDCSPEIKKLIKYEACSWTKESIKINLHIELGKANEIEKINNIKFFAETITEIYSSLSKSTLEEMDMINLKIINTHLNDMIKEGMDIPSYAPDEQQINDWLEEGNITVIDANQHRLDRAKYDLLENYNEYKNMMWYGQGAWFVYLLSSGKLESSAGNLANLNFILNKFNADAINNIFDYLNGSDRFDEKREFGWSSWTLERHEPGIVYSSWSDNSWLNSFFVLWVLNNIRIGTDNKTLIKATKGIKRDSGLISISKNFSAKKETWNLLLSNTEDKVIEFETIYNDAKAAQAKAENALLIQEPLYTPKLESFSNGIKEAHKKEAFMREIFQKNNAFEDLTTAETEEDMVIYVSKFLDKPMFVKDWDSSYFGFENQFGGSLAITENQLVLAAMLSNSTKISIADGASILEVINLLLKTQAETGHSAQVIIIPFLKYDEQSILTSSNDFIHKSGLDQSQNDYGNLDSFRGLYKNIPLFQANNALLNKMVLVANITKFGKIRQLKIKDLSGEMFEIKYEVVTGEKLEQEALRDIWKNDENGNPLNPDEVKERIQKYIAVTVAEKFEVVLQDGACVTSATYLNALGS